jgi:predicted permease
MSLASRFAGGLRALASMKRSKAELDEELRGFAEASAEEKMRAGMPHDEALRAARVELGSAAAVGEYTRDVGWESLLESAWRDARYALRGLARNPGFTAVAVLALALGIGANTAIFQLVNAVRLRTLPVEAPEELAEVRLASMKGARGGFARDVAVTNTVWEQIRARQQAFSRVAAWGAENVNLAAGGEVRWVRVMYVSGDFFAALGVPPTLGRVLNANDDVRGCASPGVVLSNAFWQREYGGDPSIIGRELRLAEHSFTIVGVTPASFFGMEVGRRFDFVLPICAIAQVRGNERFLGGIMWWLTVIGRLKPGWSLERATAQLEAISSSVFAAALPANYPPASIKDFLGSKLVATSAGRGVSELRQQYTQPLWVLLAIAGAVLLIACANLANLLLARATVREREIAVRQALGARRGRLVRQLLMESLLLAAIGAALGVALAHALTGVLVGFLSSTDHPVFLDLTTDRRVLGFTAGVTMLTALLFGLAPALRATRTAPAAMMKTGRGMTMAREGFSLRRALVVAQVALSLVLVAGALLFTRSLQKILGIDAGFRAERVLVAKVNFGRLHLPEARNQLFNQEVLARIRAIAGVESAAITDIVPLNDWGGGRAWREGADAREFHDTNLSRVGADYFKTLDIPFLAGRDFDARDKEGTPNVAIVNQAFAKQFFGGTNPVGRRFWIAASPGSPDTPYEVVGLAGDTKYGDLREDFKPIVYYAATQDTEGAGAQVLVRSRLPQGEVVAAVKRVLNDMSPSITIAFDGLKPMVEATILRERLLATLSGFFGLLALVLAGSGLYGLLAYGVASRTHEIGIRMALGAERWHVRWLIVRETLLLVACGIAVGLPIIFGLARVASTLLYGLTPSDPRTLLGALGLLVSVALMAGYVPARRATRVEPMIALRHE